MDGTAAATLLTVGVMALGSLKLSAVVKQLFFVAGYTLLTFSQL
jgi:hypothetical protein